MKGQLATLRVFLRFCVSVDAVQSGLDEKIILPTTTAADARDELLSKDRAQKILDHLERYRYARLEHALFEVVWHTGLRIGAATGIDVEDYDPDDQYLALVHRPNTGTSLKNGSKSERLVALNERVCRVLDDWLAVNHPRVVDDYGRTPLFATKRNRLSRNRGRTIAYQYTRPCVYENDCPHDRDIDECEARPTEYAHKCPISVESTSCSKGFDYTPSSIGYPRKNCERSNGRWHGRTGATLRSAIR